MPNKNGLSLNVLSDKSGDVTSMDRPEMDMETRRRAEAACVKLAEAVEELDALGFEAYATHAHLCLELVRQHLAQSLH